MLSKVMEWLRGDSGSSVSSEPAAPVTAPEPPSMPSEPPADVASEAPPDPAVDEPS
jgi:hypothetical protein